MVWLATNACNARCLHCSSASAAGAPDELGTDEALDLVDQLADAGVVDLAVSGGEPLMRRDLPAVIAHARSRGLAVGVGSNGAAVTGRQLARLARLGVGRFQVSLDGFAPSHDRLRRWPGLFARALRAVALALEAGLRTHVCCTVNRLNAAELEAFVDLVAGIGVARLNLSRYVPTGRGTGALDLEDEEWRRVIRLCAALRVRYRGRLEIVTHLAQEILVDDEVAGLPGFTGCQAGAAQGCVTANGTVLPCVLLPVAVGSVRGRRFAEVWAASPVIRALQERERLSDPCGACPVRDRCGGCRAVAYARTGDYLASDPRCWLAHGAAAAGTAARHGGGDDGQGRGTARA